VSPCFIHRSILEFVDGLLDGGAEYAWCKRQPEVAPIEETSIFY
jgi:hypothetical protein